MKRVKRVEVATVEELIAVTNEATLTPLDPNAPLWDCVAVTRKKGGEAWDGENEGFPEPPVVLLRISHAIGDGIALVNVLKKISTALDGRDAPVGFSTTRSHVSIVSRPSLGVRDVHLRVRVRFLQGSAHRGGTVRHEDGV